MSEVKLSPVSAYVKEDQLGRLVGGVFLRGKLVSQPQAYPQETRAQFIDRVVGICAEVMQLVETFEN